MTDNQKRALGIGAIGAVGLVVLRRRRTSPPATVVTNSSASGSITPFVPQTPIVLQPTESVYDPNSEALINTPTAIPTQAAAPAQPGYVVNVNYPKVATTRRARRKPTKRKVRKAA